MLNLAFLLLNPQYRSGYVNLYCFHFFFTLECIFVHVCLSGLLEEHLQEIRALRQRLEESIRTNDLLREQLEKRLAEVEKDPGTHLKSLFICLCLFDY